MPRGSHKRTAIEAPDTAAEARCDTNFRGLASRIASASAFEAISARSLVGGYPRAEALIQAAGPIGCCRPTKATTPTTSSGT